jgi:hypothetical protein
MRSLSVAATFVVGYVLSTAQNSTPEIETQVAPSLKPPEPDNPAALVAPNLKSLSPELPDSPAMETLKSLDPELENPTTQAVPDLSAPIPPKTR